MAGETSRTNGRLGGRPRGTENEATKTRREMRRRWLERIQEEADKIFDAQLNLALGTWVEISTPQGPARVYKRPPDRGSLQWIMEHVWGSARQFQNLEDTDEAGEEKEMDEETKALIKQAMRFAAPTSQRGG